MTALRRPPAERAVHFRSSGLPRVRRVTGRWAGQAGLPTEQAADFVLAVHEVAVNAVLYGSAAARLVLRITAGGLAEAEVCDRGRWRLGSMAVPAARGGVGLRVVRQLCDEVEVRASPAGTTVRLRMRLPGRAQPPGNRWLAVEGG